jgi:hypothetical protein
MLLRSLIAAGVLAIAALLAAWPQRPIVVVAASPAATPAVVVPAVVPLPAYSYWGWGTRVTDPCGYYGYRFNGWGCVPR